MISSNVSGRVSIEIEDTNGSINNPNIKTNTKSKKNISVVHEGIKNIIFDTKFGIGALEGCLLGAVVGTAASIYMNVKHDKEASYNTVSTTVIIMCTSIAVGTLVFGLGAKYGIEFFQYVINYCKSKSLATSENNPSTSADESEENSEEMRITNNYNLEIIPLNAAPQSLVADKHNQIRLSSIIEDETYV